jgi:DNA-binding NarL/FixJ family response regulator
VATESGQLWSSILQNEPDVLLLSTQLADGSGLALLPTIRGDHPKLPIIMLADESHAAHVAVAHRAGAVGFLSKAVDRARFVAAVLRASTGEKLWTRADIRRVTGVSMRCEDYLCDDVPLTRREHQVLHGLTFGWTNRRIAEHLQISSETVKEHVQHLLRKLGVEDRTQAAVWAVRKGVA